MKLEDYRHLDCEANAHVLPTSSGTHHLHIPRRYDVRRLLRIVEREALDQLESGQNFGVHGMSPDIPINTTK